ncbi:MAG TPA: hypothetical protein PLC98_25090 [Anaerolineales bacterium]|nr:hypothetical protein [Anaerolineales bacterium]
MNRNDFKAILFRGIAVLHAISAVLFAVVEVSQTNQHRIGPIGMMYPGPEHAYGVTRMLAMLGIGALSMAGAFLWPGRARASGWAEMAVAFGAGLVVSALSVFVLYQYACCDSPVFVLAGFPSSWLHIMTVTPRDPSSPIPYVLWEGVTRFSWYIDPGSAGVTVLFWVNALRGGFVLARMLWRGGLQRPPLSIRP